MRIRNAQQNITPMEQVKIKLDGKNKMYIVTNIWGGYNNGLVLKRLWKSKKIYFASFNENDEYLEGSFTSYGIDHANDLLNSLNK